MPPPFIIPTLSWLVENCKCALPVSIPLHREGTSSVVGPIYRLDVTFKMDFAKGKVLVVYGAEQNGSETEISTADAAYHWKWGIQSGYGYVLPCKEASAVSPEELKDNNLVIFGTPQTSKVLASFSTSLPIKIGENRIEVANRVYEGKDIGVVMLAPNPYNKDKFLLIYCAFAPFLQWGCLKIFHGQSDYLVFSKENLRGGASSPVLEEGFFLKIDSRKWEAIPSRKEVK